MTKPRPPRPVRAWAETVSPGDLRIACNVWGTVNVAKTRKRCALYSMDENAKPIRVTILPDGATSAEAEARKLRRALREVRNVIETRAPRDATWRPFLVTQIDAALRRKGGSR